MKLISVFGLLFLLTASVFGEYPAYRWINPYERESLGGETVFVTDFDKVDSVIGQNQCELSFDSGGVKVISTGVDPYFWTGNVSSANGKPITERIRFHITICSDTGPAQIFWSSDKFGGFDEDRSMRFSVENDEKSHKYSLDAMIEGNLRQIRIDPGSKAGTAIVEKLEIEQLVQSPIEITNVYSDQDKLEIEITNHSSEEISMDIGFITKRDPEKQTLAPNQKIVVSCPFTKTVPFEYQLISVSIPEKKTILARSAYVFFEDAMHNVPESDWKTIQSDEIECRFFKGIGAVIMKKDTKKNNRNEILGVICPLLHEDIALPPNEKSIGARIYADPPVTTHFPFGPISPMVAKSDSSSITFTSDEKHKYQPVRELTFTLDKDELSFKMNSTDKLFGPVFRPFGRMEQAVLSGVEYIEKGEHSSSTADLKTPEHVRFAPKPLLLTIPFAGIITDRCSFGLMWNDPLETRLIFATPDFLEGKQPLDPMGHRISLFGSKMDGVLRITSAYDPKSETIEDAILWAVKKRELPRLPDIPRTLEQQQKLNLAGFMDSELKASSEETLKWYHAILPGGGQPFGAINSGDFASTIWQITGKLPSGNHTYSRGGAHLENPCAFFITGLTQNWLDQINAISKGQRNSQKEDGSFRYSGQYLKGHWEDTASGFCGNIVVQLFDHYRYTGDADSLAAAIKGTDFLNKQRTPRGAQTWELSLHTPDIMGSAWCCIANTRAFEATQKTEYLHEAKRWAISGLPFVYQWETFLGGKEWPVMLYATTPVLGATNWVAPNWIGLPVQWCGLDYAEALFIFAPYDDSLDWKKVAEGILIAGEQMQYETGPSVGLLPDSWVIAEQRPQPFDINPAVLGRLRRRVNGQLAALDVKVSPDGQTRVVAPFPIKFDGNGYTIDAPEVADFQIIVNGQVVNPDSDILESF